MGGPRGGGRTGPPGALLGETPGEPAGHVAMHPDARRDDTVYLWQLFVRPRWVGTGLAHWLHEAFVAEGRARGARAVGGPAPRPRVPRGHAVDAGAARSGAAVLRAARLARRRAAGRAV